jgi:predicted dehydrogenase
VRRTQENSKRYDTILAYKFTFIFEKNISVIAKLHNREKKKMDQSRNESKSECVRLIIVGCGNRGEIYASYSLQHPERARVVGVCELRPSTRARLVEIHKEAIESEKIFADWRSIKQSGLADSVVIALPDKEHKSAAVHFMQLGYNVLLEKPMATLLDDCKQIVMKSREVNKERVLINAVSHVLRYYEPCRKIKELIESKLIGDVVNINHTEPVGN